MPSIDWPDQRSSSSTSTVMLARQEMKRKKRLQNVKSTVSTYLEPVVQRKLKKKPGMKKMANVPSLEPLPRMPSRKGKTKSAPVLFPSNQDDGPPSFKVTRVDEDDSQFHPGSAIQGFDFNMAPRRVHSHPPNGRNKKLPSLNKKDTYIRSRKTNRYSEKQPEEPSTNRDGTANSDASTVFGSGENALDLFDADDDVLAISPPPKSRSGTAPPVLRSDAEESPTAPNNEDALRQENRNVQGPEEDEEEQYEDEFEDDEEDGQAKSKEGQRAFISKDEEPHSEPKIQELSMESLRLEDNQTKATALSAKTSSLRRKSKLSKAENAKMTSHNNNNNEAKSQVEVKASRPGRKTLKVKPAAPTKKAEEKSEEAGNRSGKARKPKKKTGSSLSDLQAEHKEALELLKELGGPMEGDQPSKFVPKLRQSVHLAEQKEDQGSSEYEKKELEQEVAQEKHQQAVTDVVNAPESDNLDLDLQAKDIPLEKNQDVVDTDDFGAVFATAAEAVASPVPQIDASEDYELDFSDED